MSITYEDLSEFEKKCVDKFIEEALDSATTFEGTPINQHDRKVMKEFFRNDLSYLEIGNFKLYH